MLQVKQPRIKTLLFSALMLASAMASAVEFRSVMAPKAVLYDAPSVQGKKLYVMGQGYPVEVIVNLGDWLKVRDGQGSLSWIEARQLGEKRTVLVRTAGAEIRQSADGGAAVLGRAEQDVVLEMLEPMNNGWVKVRHRDGLTGYISAATVWGF